VYRLDHTQKKQIHISTSIVLTTMSFSYSYLQVYKKVRNRSHAPKNANSDSCETNLIETSIFVLSTKLEFAFLPNSYVECTKKGIVPPLKAKMRFSNI